MAAMGLKKTVNLHSINKTITSRNGERLHSTDTNRLQKTIAASAYPISARGQFVTQAGTAPLRLKRRRTQPPKSSTSVNTAGITSKLSTVEVISPPITATAIGARKLASAVPHPTAIGNMPAPMASVVMMTGRARLWQASISASCLIPSGRAADGNA